MIIYSGEPIFEYDYLHEFEHKFKKGNSYLVIGKSLEIFELTREQQRVVRREELQHPSAPLIS
jgi:hypothetical protein